MKKSSGESLEKIVNKPRPYVEIEKVTYEVHGLIGKFVYPVYEEDEFRHIARYNDHIFTERGSWTLVQMIMYCSTSDHVGPRKRIFLENFDGVYGVTLLDIKPFLKIQPIRPPKKIPYKSPIHYEIDYSKLKSDYYAKIFTISERTGIPRPALVGIIKSAKLATINSDGQAAVNLKTLIPYLNDYTGYKREALVLFDLYLNAGKGISTLTERGKVIKEKL